MPPIGNPPIPLRSAPTPSDVESAMAPALGCPDPIERFPEIPAAVEAGEG